MRYGPVWSRFEWIIVYSLKMECGSSTSAWIMMHSTYTVSCNVPAVSVMLRLVACVNLYPSLFKPHLIVTGEGLWSTSVFDSPVYLVLPYRFCTIVSSICREAGSLHDTFIIHPFRICPTIRHDHSADSLTPTQWNKTK